MSSSDSTNKKQNDSPNIKGFIIYILIIFLIIVFNFTFASSILYLCKIAQSNTLPTDVNCYPYTNTNPSIEPKQINIFETHDKSDKIQFPYELNSKNKLIDWFREYKNKHSSHFLANYFISIADHILEFNYFSINSIMNSIHSTFSEGVIIGSGSILFLTLYIFGMIANNVYFIYIWFANMYWFFKSNNNKSDQGVPEWDDVSMFLNPINWSIGVGFVILFSFLFLLGYGLIAGIPILLFHNTLISSLCYRGLFNNNANPIGLLTIIQEVFVHYKVPIISLFSFFIILQSFINLGTIPGISSLIVTALIYHGTINMNIFNIDKDLNMTPLTDYNQAKKTCVKQPEVTHGLINKLFKLFLNKNKKGGEITHQIKQIHKNLNTIDPTNL